MNMKKIILITLIAFFSIESKTDYMNYLDLSNKLLTFA